jgi:hypothetical protein|tara:strand:+ start:4683 stop:6599 length:1917 start_codon:yes stop_codon:yes gene_type:complete
MLNKIKIINKDWEDNIIINFEKLILSRQTKKEDSANFTIQNNILIVKWLNWNEEYFAEYNNIFYTLKKINFKTTDWEDICYIDYYNNIVYRPNENKKGIMKLVNNDSYYIKWEFLEKNFLSNILNIKKMENNKIELKKLENNNKYVIPNILHFVYGFKKQTEDFELYKYLSIKSAIDINKPTKVYFHYKYEPIGKYWEKIKPYLTLEYVEPPSEIYGNDLLHYAHQADVIRLQKLQKYGGIYLDIDTICLKSFNDLRVYDFVIGIQGNNNNSEIYGLCNAVMLSKPQSEFVIEWIDTYTTFRSKGRDEYWDEHSVLMPLKLAYKYTNKIKILDNNVFYNPLWYNIHDILFNEKINIDEYKKLVNNNYCIHLWDTYTNEYLSKLTCEDILNTNTLYNIFTRKFLRNKISIVFLTYNRLDSTRRCLESYLECLSNDYILELLIFDNNSDIDTVNYLKKFQTNNYKIKIIFNDENIGVCNGRIKLFKESKGDIICSLDSDAELLNQSFFNLIIEKLYDEKYGIIGISGAYIKTWNFGEQSDINNNDTNEYYCHHISGCCQIFRRDLFHVGFGLDKEYGFFWCEDTDLSFQSMYLNKINYRIDGSKYIEHKWGGSGAKYHDLFIKNWKYFSDKWRNKFLEIR